MSLIFISFSKDFDIALKLKKELEERDFDIWIYLKDIPPTVDWLEEIYKGIERSDIFLFLISPDSINSDTCQKEIKHAVKNGKRLIPVVVRKIEFREAPEEIRKLQASISFEAEEKFDEVLEELLKVIYKNSEWVKDHTTLLLRAKEWIGSGKAKNKLLRSDVWEFDKKIRDVDERLKEERYRSQQKRNFLGPEPTNLHREYIAESKKEVLGIWAKNILIASAILFTFFIAVTWFSSQVGFAQLGEHQANETAQAQSTARAQQAFTAEAANTREAQQAFTAEAANTREAQQITTAQAANTQKAEQASTAQAAVEAIATAQVASGVNESLARKLSAQAENISLEQTQSVILSGLLATEAIKRYPHLEADQAVRNYLNAEIGKKSLSLEVVSMTHGGRVDSIAFSPNGKWIISGSHDNTTRIWDVTTGQEISRMTVDGLVVSVDVSQDSKWVAQAACEGISEGYVNCGKAVIRIWEAETGKEIYQLKPSFGITTIKLIPGSAQIMIAGSNRSLQLWDFTNGKVLTSFDVELLGRLLAGQAGTWVNNVDVDPLGRWITAHGQIWAKDSGKELFRLVTKEGVNLAIFSPSGKWIASTGAYNVRLWNSENGEELLHLPVEPFTGAASLAFSSDEKWLIGADGNMIHVWETSTGREISRITTNIVTSLDFSPDGNWVVSGSIDNTVRVWLWRPEDLYSAACFQLPRNFSKEEWRLYIGNEPYQPTCPNLPIPTE